ncbi:DsbA family protein [Bartonella florencae]|uniref:DsbA family protein n=1 Tax=Bartonella florencae TaxID=928210 RepID=UPI000561946F|nr:DsbA family protein [Bartonella florencae]
MIHQPKHSKITLVTKFSVIIMLSVLIFSSSLSNATANEKAAPKDLKTLLLKDPTFLSELKEKITSPLNENDIQKIVRDYLLKNPEIIIEMQLALQEKLEKRNEQNTQKQASAIKLLKKEIFYSPHDATLGNPNGKRVLVDFFDYNCRYCKLSYPYIENLIKEYPDLRVIIKDLPILGPDSIAAHTVAYAFRKQFPEKYPQFYKALLTNKSRVNEAIAIKIAVSLGADEKALRNAIKDPNIKNFFKENIQIASQLNITGTPSYIIDNKVFIGAIEQDVLKASIEAIE